MSLAARRVGYSFAIGLFLVVAPVVIAITLGYRWTGWDNGFVKTGVLVTSSQPRAQLILNDAYRGETPKRIAGLTPGTYRVKLEKSGYQPWEQLVRVGANTASVIGPVQLFPLRPAETAIDSNSTTVLHDDAFGTVFSLAPTTTSWILTERWPGHSAITLPAEPTSLYRSRRGQTTLFEHGTVQTVITESRPDQRWEIDRAEAIVWASESETVFWGRRGQDIIQFDAVTQLQTPSVQGTSHTVVDNRLWYTQQTASETILYRRAAIGNDTPVLVESFEGTWELLPGVIGLALRRSDHQTQFLQFEPLTQQLRQTSLGNVDQMFWGSTSQSPLWIDGVNLKTFSRDQVRLLERNPNEFTYLGWIDSLKLLLTVETTQVMIRGYGPEQGQVIAFTYPLSPQERVVGIDLTHSRFVVHDNVLGSLREVYWDEPERAPSQ